MKVLQIGKVISLILVFICFTFLLAWQPIIALALLLAVIFVFIAFTNPYLAIYFIAIFIPFVDLISSKWVPEEYTSIVKFVSEISVIVLLITVFVRKAVQREKIFFNRAYVYFLVFMIVAILATIINQVDLEHFIFGFTVLIRYIFLFFTVSQLKWKRKQLRTLYAVILAIGIMEVLISFGQVIIGDSFKSFFTSEVKRTVSSNTIYSIEKQALDLAWVSGTFSRYNLLGGFLMLWLNLVLVGFFIVKKNLYKLGLGISLVLGIVVLILSNSRNSWMGTFFSFMAILILLNKRKIIAIISIIAVCLVMLLISVYQPVALSVTEGAGATPVERFLGVFSGEYIQKSLQNDRLFLLTKASTQIITYKPLLGLGMGAAWSSQEAAFGDFKYGVLLNLPIDAWFYLGDVGWIAIMTQAGLLGLASFLAFMISLYVQVIKELKKFFGIEQVLLLSFFAMTVAMIITNIWSFNLTYRSTSFYFWLIGGVAFSLLTRARKEKKS